MSEKPYNVLFLCTGNSARSIERFLSWPIATLDRMTMQARLKDIGQG